MEILERRKQEQEEAEALAEEAATSQVEYTMEED